MTGALAVRFGLRSRGQKWRLYRTHFDPRVGERVLDVGVSSLDGLPGENYFLRTYPHPAQLTGVGVQDLSDLSVAHPAVAFMQADGCSLPFGDRTFDIVHSNAVVEHVGAIDRQRQFIRELCRVADAGFITTPNRWHPVETHTRLPLVHWLPRRAMLRAMALLGKHDEGFWLLSRRKLLSLFPPDVKTEVFSTRIGGLPATTIVVFRREGVAS